MSSNRTDLHFLASPYPQICNLLDVLNLPPRSKEEAETKDGRDDLSTSAYQISKEERIAQGAKQQNVYSVGITPSETDLLSREIGIGWLKGDV
jgi:hypothetical protein